MCVNPYIAKTKDGRYVPVPCGKCLECRKDYQNEWTFRLTQECKRAPLPAFITLTYNEENLRWGDTDDGEPQSVLVKSDLQLFMKRLRKNGGELLQGCRYFAVGEYGSKFNRAHYHLVLIAPKIKYLYQELDKLVKKSWTLGFSYTKPCTDKQIHYVCKYMNKLDERPHLVKPFRLYSRSIGLNYLSQKIIDYYLTTFKRTCLNGRCEIGLPRYYIRKLDEMSDCNPYLKKAGLKYSDMLEDIQPKEGSKYYFMKYFTEHFNEIRDNVSNSITLYDGDIECWKVNLKNPTPQEVWQCYRRSIKYLTDILREDSRLLLQCKIRNKLLDIQPVTPAELVKEVV